MDEMPRVDVRMEPFTDESGESFMRFHLNVRDDLMRAVAIPREEFDRQLQPCQQRFVQRLLYGDDTPLGISMSAHGRSWIEDAFARMWATAKRSPGVTMTKASLADWKPRGRTARTVFLDEASDWVVTGADWDAERTRLLVSGRQCGKSERNREIMEALMQGEVATYEGMTMRWLAETAKPGFVQHTLPIASTISLRGIPRTGAMEQVDQLYARRAQPEAMRRFRNEYEGRFQP